MERSYESIVDNVIVYIVVVFMVGKYVSLEAKIAANKDMYYAALRESSDAWYGESSCLRLSFGIGYKCYWSLIMILRT